ncbi:NAD(P)H-dependent glycerol-3-phosphate dehydrogenase [Candidatus Uabimicrobium sp. HlEnr_7]|uniref:NAD(P)H-dependent glycerol-3-phosphate dehydrogenase n=1 Tax=Candidatus Uabimicrobium helgolandensis TaxID=3095367 RepID=UPI003555E2A2
MKKIAVLGAGSYGTAIAYHLAKKFENSREYDVCLYARSKSIVEEINGRNTNNKYTKTILPKNLVAHNSLHEAIDKTNYIIMGVPAQSIRSLAKELSDIVKDKTTIINLAKGLEVGSFKRMSQVVKEELGAIKHEITSLGGPAFSKDIFAHHPIGVTLGGKNHKTLHEIRLLFDTETFDVKITKDVIGVELGGALKNVFGIMAGVMSGTDMGSSINGDFLTRSIVDMKAIASYMGARRATLDGRAGLGDLAITCTEGSRNFRFGREFAQQYQKNSTLTIDVLLKNTLEALQIKTVEGFYTLEPLYQLCESSNMFVPIVNNLYKMLYQSDCSPEEAVHRYRIRDKIRSREARLTISRIFSFLFPRIWYRRERGFFGVKNL